MNFLFNHTSPETAKTVKDYPWGFKLRTEQRYWIETVAKKGDRFVTQTKNPKSGLWCKPKKSTYSCLIVMVENEKQHVSSSSVNIYAHKDKVKTFVEGFGGVDKLNELQRVMYNQLQGINEVKHDKLTGEVIKDYSIKWERNHNKELRRLTITFDRPDGVQVKEIYQALKKVNKERLNQMFEDGGRVAVCVRGGVPLGGVSQSDYKEWLASDENN